MLNAEINAVNLDCKLKVLKEKFENELDSVMKFWLENSHDASHGYVCIYKQLLSTPKQWRSQSCPVEIRMQFESAINLLPSPQDEFQCM